MVGHVEEKNLRGADQQRGLDPRRLRRRAALEEETEEMAQRAEPAQHGRDQRPRQRAVAVRQAGKAAARVRVRPSSCSSSGRRRRNTPSTNVGGEAPDGEAGHVVERGTGGAAWVWRGVHRGRLARDRLHWARASLQPAHGYAKSKAMPTDPIRNRQASRQRRTESNLPPKPPLTPAAERALAEAAARRAEGDRAAPDRPKEIQGRDGPEPTRYGDWEINGLTSDF